MPATATTAAGSRIRASCRSRWKSSSKVLGDKPNQIGKQRDDVLVTATDLTDFRPEAPITEAGLRNNINVGIHYPGSWLAGNGCVPIHNLMEDAATAEISRSQVWQWIRSPKGTLDDGRKVTRGAGARSSPTQELDKVKQAVGGDTQRRADARRRRSSTQHVDVAEQFDGLPDAAEFIAYLD